MLYSILESPPAGMENEGAWQAVWAELFRIADSGLDAATMLATGSPVEPALLVDGRQRLELLREQVPGGLELKLDSQLAPGHGAASPCRSVRSRAATAPPQMPRDIDFGALAQFIQQAVTTKPSGPTLAAVLR